MTVDSEKHVSSYGVLVDGQEIAREHKDRIREIRVVDYLALPDVCTLQIGYPKPKQKTDPFLIDSQPFGIGKKLEVRMGGREERSPTAVFKGEITTLEPEFGAGGISLTVRAFDHAHVLHRARKSRPFANQTSSDIVSKIVKEAGLTPRCDASGGPHEFIQQDNETDWDFIWRLAERIGFEFLVDDKTAHFRRPGSGQEVELEWQGELISFHPRATSVQQVEEVTVRSYDPKSKKLIEASAKAPNQIARIGLQRSAVKRTGSTVHVATEPVKTQAEGNALAQALLDKLANGYIAAEGTAQGNPRIKAGAKVKINGVGTTFGGTYRVATSTHVLRGGGTYTTHFANSPVHTISGMAGGAQSRRLFADHLVLAEVTNNNDPENLGRVKLRYHTLAGEIESTWARVAVPSAGKERGLMMLPVPGEEVLVGFEHGDTTRPYVLGSLFNGKDTPGAELADHDGSFALRSDKKALMASKEDMTFRSDGNLTVEVTKDVTEKVTGKLATKVTGALEIEGAQGVTIKGGPNITVEAKASLTLKAPQVSIQGSGMVSISGGQVSVG